MNDRDMAADVIAEIEVQRLQTIQLMRCHADRLKKKAHRRGKEIEHLQTVIRGAWTQVRTVVRLKKEAEAERDALRARVAQLEAAAVSAQAALEPVARGVRDVGSAWCLWCAATRERREHAPTCPTTRARAARDALTAALTPSAAHQPPPTGAGVAGEERTG